MKREIITTADGSSSIRMVDWNENYHSQHGAIQEAYHVFIRNGLEHWRKANPAKKEISILEIGFGTGLNAFITYLETKNLNLRINYEGVEAYPVSKEEAEQLNYVSELNARFSKDIFLKMHDISWDESHELGSHLTLRKRLQRFEEITDSAKFDLIYFDAFGANVQAELWTENMFEKMYLALKNSGILVTYAAKGSVRRAMLEAGFLTERLPGPPGKREMLRAAKQL
jgi:tRNA U34 5-methylaminomethyl-2-thiouridine-forming methyltransferase MnmC